MPPGMPPGQQAQQLTIKQTLDTLIMRERSQITSSISLAFDQAIYPRTLVIDGLIQDLKTANKKIKSLEEELRLARAEQHSVNKPPEATKNINTKLPPKQHE